MENKRFPLYQTNPDFYNHIQKVSGIQNKLGQDVLLSAFPEKILIRMDKESVIQNMKDGLSWYRKPIDVTDLTQIAEECSGEECRLVVDMNKLHSLETIVPFLEKCHILEIPLSFYVYENRLPDIVFKLLKKYGCSVSIVCKNGTKMEQIIKQFVKEGISAEAQYVLSEKNLCDAINVLGKHPFPQEIRRVFFSIERSGFSTSFKPESVIYMEELVKKASKNTWYQKVEFSSCLAPIMQCLGENQIKKGLLQSCDAGLFSACISSDMYFLPCPLDKRKRWAEDLRTTTIQKAWKSSFFDLFRQGFIFACSGCSSQSKCGGACPMKAKFS